MSANSPSTAATTARRRASALINNFGSFSITVEKVDEADGEE